MNSNPLLLDIYCSGNSVLFEEQGNIEPHAFSDGVHLDDNNSRSIGDSCDRVVPSGVEVRNHLQDGNFPAIPTYWYEDMLEFFET